MSSIARRPPDTPASQWLSISLFSGGILLGLVGTLRGALAPGLGGGGIMAGPIGSALVAGGGFAVALLVFVLSPSRLVRALDRWAPHLYPYAPRTADLALYVALVVGSVTVFTGILDVFANVQPVSGSSWGVGSPMAGGLLVAASLVIWTLGVALALGLGRAVRLGRALDRARGVDVYRQGPEPEELDPPEPPRPAIGAAPPHAALVVYGFTVAFSIGISAAIEVVTAPFAPLPPADWLAGLAILPVWSIAVVAGIGQIDRATRSLERGYSALFEGPHPVGSMRSTPPDPPSAGGGAPMTSQFVH